MTRNWRRFAAAIVATVAAFAVPSAPALRGSGAAAAEGGSAQQFTIKISHPLPPGTSLHLWAEHLKAGVEKRAPDRFKVQIYPASQLGAIPRMIEGAQLGTIEIIQVPPAFLSGVDPRFSVVAAPGIFDDVAHADRTVHDPAFRKLFWPIGEAKGLKLVGLGCDAPGDYATVKPIRTLEDFRGLKLRVFGSPLEIEALRRLGATGVPMPLAEVISAIQQRTIDGNKAGMPVFVPFKYQNVAKYVLAPKDSIICVTKFASKLWFDKLPANLQSILLEEGLAADKKMLPWAIARLEKLYKAWVDGGGVLTRLSPEDQAELRRKLSTVGEDVLEDQPEVLELYKVMKAVAERRREG